MLTLGNETTIKVIAPKFNTQNRMEITDTEET